MHSLRWILLALASAGPALAQARPAAIYPLSGHEVGADERLGIEGSLQAALVRASRFGRLTLASPTTLHESCGPASKAEPACLARLAGTGLVLFGTARRAGALLAVTLSAIDARAAIAGPVTAFVDPLLDNPQVLLPALERLADGAPPRVEPAAAGARASAAASPAVRAPDSAPVAGAAPPARTKAPDEAVQDAPSDAWMTRVAIGSGVGALAALGGGLAAGYLAKSGNDTLASRYEGHALTAADAPSYAKVKRYGAIANALFVASGALALAGITFLALTVDDGGPGLGGRF